MEHIQNTLTVPCEKSKTVPLDSSKTKYIAVCPAQSRFAIKLMWCIALGSALRACCLFKSSAMVL